MYKNFRYSYGDDIGVTNSISNVDVISFKPDESVRNESVMSDLELATAQADTKEIMNSETIAPSETIQKRLINF